MKNRRMIALDERQALAYLALALAAALLLIGATMTKRKGVVTELGVDNTDGGWVELAGTYVCVVWSTSWDGATASLQKLVAGTPTTPVSTKAVAPTALATRTSGTLASSSWAELVAGRGWYQLEASGGGGSESINWQCAPVPGR